MNATDIGRRLRGQRAVLGLTQIEVAELAGVSRRAVVELESAKGARGATMNTLIAVCSVLGLAVTVTEAPRGRRDA
jgi:transcriptional regulator with XRE-family HTH domain